MSFTSLALITDLSNYSIFSKESENREVLVYQGKTVKVLVPQYALFEGSLKIESTNTFSNIDSDTQKEIYHCLQKIISCWKKLGIKNYLIYTRDHSNTTYSAEIIPFINDSWKYVNQFKVLWNITFGGVFQSLEKRKKISKIYKKFLSFKNISSFTIKNTQSIDSSKTIFFDPFSKKMVSEAFCENKVLESLLIYKGKTIHVLYNYNPLNVNEEKLHFLLTPIEHRFHFSDLEENEYLEILSCTQKIVSHYRKKGYSTAYLYDKSEKLTGQTVAQWHQHLVFTANKTEELFGKILLFKKMILGSVPLTEKEIQVKVNVLKEEKLLT